MIRRIIKQGHNTLTITLPSKWVKNYNVKPGGEISISETGSALLISAEKKDDLLKTEIDIKELDLPNIWKYMMAVYREGYDEITIKFNNTQLYENPYKYFTPFTVDEKYYKSKPDLTPLEFLQLMAQRFVGYEVIEHHDNYAIIKDMAEVSSKQFDSSLRRVFLLLLQMGNELTEAIKLNNPTMVRRTHDLDNNVDKFHDYCVRVLNKTGFQSAKKSHLIFSTLFLLELLGDEFKHVAYHIMHSTKETKLIGIKTISQATLQHLQDFYQLYYQFDREKLLNMSRQDLDQLFSLPGMTKKLNTKPNPREIEIFNHFRRISRYITSLIELRIEMEV
ncbi:phosphate uptake regulator PhoU [Candidatus Woesearchaeota archaeon]|nr:phosphate uptake regulator PhoU [Candidatus Woesearchaeota archaeon]